MRENKTVYRVLVRKPTEKDQLEEPGVDGRIIKKGLKEVGWYCEDCAGKIRSV